MNAAQRLALFLVMIAAGAGLVVLGMVSKMQHWPVGNYLLGGGLLLEISAGVGLAITSSRKFRTK
jgi:hypothetical protein